MSLITDLEEIVNHMATGRVDVLRRRDSYNYSKREFESYRNGVCRGDGVKHKNGFHLPSNVHNSGGSERSSNSSEPCSRNGKTRKSECLVQLPPEKKRKFSPIIWDREEKQVRVSSKNRVVPVIPPSPAHPTSVQNVLFDGVVSKSPVTVVKSQEVEVFESSVADYLEGSCQSEAPADLSTQLHSEHSGQDEQAKKNMVHPPNISFSRWASDSDSPRAPRDIADDPCSSPESGEIQREGSGGSRTRVSSSDEESSFETPGEKYYGEDELCDKNMNIDKHDGNAGVAINQLYSDSESDSEDDVDIPKIEEPAVPMQGSINMLQGCRSVFEYEKLNKINEGTYGVVYRARDKKTGEIVALKKVKMDVDKGCDGFPMSALREINILLSFNHPSVVGVKEVVMDDFDGVYMVMEYMEYDLKGLMESMKQPFSIGEVKYLMLQLLNGVEYLHDNWVLHRDLKSSNLLVNKEGELKICDLGLSRQYGSPLKPYTPLVVTLWYRAPEILLGTKQYSTAIDMWSVGCIMAELLAKDALFKGKTEVDQIDKIFRMLGTPDEKSGLSKLPGFKVNSVKQPCYNHLRKKFPAASFTGSSPVLSESGFDLLKRLLSYNPAERITAKDALNHNWFRESPEPRYDFKPITPDQHSRPVPKQQAV